MPCVAAPGLGGVAGAEPSLLSKGGAGCLEGSALPLPLPPATSGWVLVATLVVATAGSRRRRALLFRAGRPAGAAAAAVSAGRIYRLRAPWPALIPATFVSRVVSIAGLVPQANSTEGKERLAALATPGASLIANVPLDCYRIA